MLDALTLSLVVVIVLAVVFDYINGFRDSANAIATSVATRALRPRTAVLMAAVLMAAVLMAAVLMAAVLMAAVLIGAIAWNLLTWWFAIPSSSSHALIGGLLGATIIAAGVGALNIEGIVSNRLLNSTRPWASSSR